MVTLDNRRYVLHVPFDDAMSFFDGLPKNPVTQVFDFVVGNDPKLDVIFFSQLRIIMQQLARFFTVVRMDEMLEIVVGIHRIGSALPFQQYRQDIRGIKFVGFRIIEPIPERNHLLDQLHPLVGVVHRLLGTHRLGDIPAHTQHFVPVERPDPVFVMPEFAVHGQVVPPGRTSFRFEHVIQIGPHVSISLLRQQLPDIHPDEPFGRNAHMIGLFGRNQLRNNPRIGPHRHHIGQGIQYPIRVFGPGLFGGAVDGAGSTTIQLCAKLLVFRFQFLNSFQQLLFPDHPCPCE